MFRAPKFIQSDLDVGAFGDLAAHGAEDGGDFFHRAADGVDGAAVAGAGRQGGIETLGGEAGVECGVFQFGAAGFDEGCERVLELVKRGATFAALLGRGLAEVAEQSSEAAVAAEHGDADCVPGAQVGAADRAAARFGLGGRRGRQT